MTDKTSDVDITGYTRERNQFIWLIQFEQVHLDENSKVQCVNSFKFFCGLVCFPRA